MGKQKIKLGIIGAGRMGITHYSIINSHPEIQITSVADPSGTILSIMSKYLPIKTYKDYKDMLKVEDLNGVLVCTPPNLHYPIIMKAAEKDLHVFVEKPFTSKLKEARELVFMYQKNGLVNQVGYVNRFNDVFGKVKEFVNNNTIGKIIRFKSEMFSCTINKPDENSGWRSKRNSGGGVIFEMASHAIDLVNFLIGKPDRVIGSSLNYIYSKNVEDAVSSTFVYKNGISGTLYVNWSDSSYRKPTNKIEIFGDRGRIMADQHSIKIFLNHPNEQFKLRHGWNTIYITDIFKPVPFYVRGNEFTRQLYHFVDCIQRRSETTICTFADGANTLEVIENIFNDYEQNGRFNK
jgi:scyllo-inositol 2-dehydrogenase (NADP+)